MRWIIAPLLLILAACEEVTPTEPEPFRIEFTGPAVVEARVQVINGTEYMACSPTLTAQAFGSGLATWVSGTLTIDGARPLTSEMDAAVMTEVWDSDRIHGGGDPRTATMSSYNRGNFTSTLTTRYLPPDGEVRSFAYTYQCVG